MNNYNSGSGSGGEELQNSRNRVKIALVIAEKVLDDFSNLKFLEKSVVTCEDKCLKKFELVYKQNERNELFDFGNLKNEFEECCEKCEDIYKKVVEHQVKGSEISYFTYQKHLNKCKEINKNEPEKLLTCYSHKVEKITKRFGSYYFNQRINLINKINKLE